MSNLFYFYIILFVINKKDKIDVSILHMDFYPVGSDSDRVRIASAENCSPDNGGQVWERHA